MADGNQPGELRDRTIEQELATEVRFSNLPATSTDSQHSDITSDKKRHHPDGQPTKRAARKSNDRIEKRAKMAHDPDDHYPNPGYDETVISAPPINPSATFDTTSPCDRKRSRRKCPPPVEVTVEIEYVTGPQAEELAQRQWAVIKEVLQWIADHPTPIQGDLPPR